MGKDEVAIAFQEYEELRQAIAVYEAAHLELMQAAQRILRIYELANKQQLHPQLVKQSPPSPTGNFCPSCGGSQMVRTGTCVTCQSCGFNTGCG